MRLARAGTAMRGNAAWVAVDAGTSVWRHRAGLRDPGNRREAAREVAWESGEAVSRGVAGGMAAVAAGGAVVAGGTAAAVGAPLAAGAAASWVAGKAVKGVRRRFKGDG